MTKQAVENIKDLPEEAKVRLAGICRGHYNSNREECTKMCMKMVSDRCKEDTIRRKKDEEKLAKEKTTKLKTEAIEEVEINDGKKSVYKYFFQRMDDGFDNYKKSVKNNIEYRHYYVGSENKCILQISENGEMYLTTTDINEKIATFTEKVVAKELIKRIFKSCNLKLRVRGKN